MVCFSSPVHLPWRVSRASTKDSRTAGMPTWHPFGSWAWGGVTAQGVELLLQLLETFLSLELEAGQLAHERYELDVWACFIFSWLFWVMGKGSSGILGWNIWQRCEACLQSPALHRDRECATTAAVDNNFRGAVGQALSRQNTLVFGWLPLKMRYLLSHWGLRGDCTLRGLLRPAKSELVGGLHLDLVGREVSAAGEVAVDSVKESSCGISQPYCSEG